MLNIWNFSRNNLHTYLCLNAKDSYEAEVFEKQDYKLLMAFRRDLRNIMRRYTYYYLWNIVKIYLKNHIKYRLNKTKYVELVIELKKRNLFMQMYFGY